MTGSTRKRSGRFPPGNGAASPAERERSPDGERSCVRLVLFVLQVFRQAPVPRRNRAGGAREPGPLETRARPARARETPGLHKVETHGNRAGDGARAGRPAPGNGTGTAGTGSTDRSAAAGGYVVRFGQRGHNRTPSRGPERRTRGSADRHRTRRGMVCRGRTGNASALGTETAVDAGHCPKPAPAHDRAPLWALPPSGAPRTNPSRDARKPGGGRLRPRRGRGPGARRRALQLRHGGTGGPVLLEGRDPLPLDLRAVAPGGGTAR